MGVNKGFEARFRPQSVQPYGYWVVAKPSIHSFRAYAEGIAGADWLWISVRLYQSTFPGLMEIPISNSLLAMSASGPS